MPKKPRNEIKARIAARKKERKALAKKDYFRAFEILQGNSVEAILHGGGFDRMISDLERTVGEEKALAAKAKGQAFIREASRTPTRESLNRLLGSLSPAERKQLDSLVSEMAQRQRLIREGKKVDPNRAFQLTMAVAPLITKALRAYLAKGITD
jgi:hypothetical protein